MAEGENFWRLLGISYGFIPQALRFLYCHLYQKTYPARTSWSSGLATDRPPLFDSAAPSLPRGVPPDFNSTVYRFCEEFSLPLNQSVFNFHPTREIFLNQETELFDVTFLCALLLQSTVKTTLVHFIRVLLVILDRAVSSLR